MTTRLVLTALGLTAGILLAQERPARGGPGRMMRPNPVFTALDTDGDGTLSPSEIQNAGTALKKLDKNGDGQLAIDEVRPNFGPRGGEDGAPQSGTDGLVTTLMGFDRNGDGKLSKDEVPERMQGLLARGDANQDGFLTKDEVLALAQAQVGANPPQGGPERGSGGRPMRMDPLMTSLDADGDGTISTAEMANAAAALKKLDKNGDGQITPDEVRPNFGPGGNPNEMMQRMFSQFDQNSDGKLSKAEVPERMQAAFDQIDEDKDGFVSRQEMQKFVQAQGMGRQRGGDRQ